MATTGNIQKSFSDFIEKKYIPIEPKAKAALAIGLILIPSVLCYFFLFKPNMEELAKLRQETAKVEQELNKAKAQAANMPALEKKLAETKKKFEASAVILPKETEIPELLRAISDRGKNAGLDFLTFKPGRETPKDFYAEIPIDIATVGPYHNMGFFLDQVSKLERLVTVNNIKMSAPKKEGSEMLLNSKCKLVTYRFTNKKIKPPQDPKKKK